MRSVILVRHAKSSWDDPAVPDFERPLNERGKHDGPMMAKRLLDKKVDIDAFIASPARRAKKTAVLFAKEYGFHKSDVILVPELYHAAPEVFYQVIAAAPAKARHIAIFSHNPGITGFVNMLTSVRVDDMPTCAVYAVQSEAADWKDFATAAREFWFFEYPKQHVG